MGNGLKSTSKPAIVTGSLAANWPPNKKTTLIHWNHAPSTAYPMQFMLAKLNL
jgi:hypothetical protein